MDRRQFLTVSAAASLAAMPVNAASAQSGEARRRWSPGEVEHLLPTVDHQNILIKASFTRPLAATPWLSVDGRRFRASPTDTDLYRTYCRSVPVFFFQDDHDHFDNDEADDNLVTFPPDWFNLNAARATQSLYYPEFLPDASRPAGLASSSAADRLPPHLSESFGTLRFGKLVEMLFYDCRRHMTLTGTSAGFVPPDVENWLVKRMQTPGVAHVVNVPSTPIGWTAGKWGEWYADMEQGRKPTLAVPKPYWQSGWRMQHDRLVRTAQA